MNKNVFYCYSPTLKKELNSIGERYINKGTNPSTNREFWVYLYTPELVQYLDNRDKAKSKYIKNRKNPKFIGE